MMDLSLYNLQSHPDISTIEWSSEDEWLELRKEGVGGSDAGAVMGISKYKSPLKVYKIKKGLIHEDLSGNANVKKGKDLEYLIRDLYVVPHMHKLGYHVTKPECIFVNRTCPWLRANVDGLAVPLTATHAGFYSNIVIEIKWVSEYGEANWGGDEYCGVPADYYAQVQHYMTVTGATHAIVCALFDSDWSMHYYPISHDITFATKLLTDSEKFYQNLLKGIPPMLSPALDKEDAVEALEHLPKIFTPSEELSSKCEQYLYLKNNIKELTTEADALQQEILQGYYAGQIPASGYRVSVSKSTRSGVDTAKLKEEFPDAYEACKTTSEFTRNTIARRK